MKSIFLLALNSFILVSSAWSADYDILDPRLPDYRHAMLYRIRVDQGFPHYGNIKVADFESLSAFDQQLYEYVSSEKPVWLSYVSDDILVQGDLGLKENWLGINEGDENYSNLQSILTGYTSAFIKEKIEIHLDVTAFRSDSTHNLDQASTTGEFLADPLLSYNFSHRGAIASEADYFELQTDRALIKTEILGIDLQTGRDRIQFKPGYRNGLLFSGLTRPIDMFYRIDYDFWRFGFTALAGQMTEEGKRYISTKRLSLKAASFLQLGVTEAVAYYDDPTAYINPIMPFYIISRHRVDNNDNLIASFDFSCTPFKSFNIYGEFLDDDLIIFEGGASKYGFTLGLFKVGFLSERLDLRTEYTQVRKWTYTHVSHLNPWEYRGQPFGFWLGNDGDELYGRADYLFTVKTSASLNFDYVRKGEGDLEHPYEDEGGDKKPPFPSGVVEKSIGGWLDFRHDLKYLELRARVGYRHIKNRHNEPGNFDSYFLHWAVDLRI